MTTPIQEMTHAEWIAEGRRRFGDDMMNWRFVCPACGHVAAARDWKDAGAPPNAVAFSCVGRWLPTAREAFADAGHGPCNYAGGGLFRLNPLHVRREDGQIEPVFAFAEDNRMPPDTPLARTVRRTQC
ncbi:VVA0879 family protein [Thiobaca trueperi]|uniref:Uncharacterized protein n=1 Tax=Thiobaca trueperi TaxID=127458 RepID=A0A4R3MZX7_9GAMM|nr:VVA0879 family protein [Thiobaca trueperi]TCT21176.1 hypothetical protein EDC35_10429 [Thiobaca trueperi]